MHRVWLCCVLLLAPLAACAVVPPPEGCHCCPPDCPCQPCECGPCVCPHEHDAALPPRPAFEPAAALLDARGAGPSRGFAAPPEAGQAPPENANFGYTPDREASEAFIRSLPAPSLRQAAPHLFDGAGDPRGPPVLLYRALLEAHQAKLGRPFVVGRQGIGDCVSWGWAHGLDVAQAVRWKLRETDVWIPAATEPIYGGSRVEARGRTRGGYSDGSYGAAAAKWVAKTGGAIYRQVYQPADGRGEPLDLTVYSARRAKDWGNYGCGGSGDWGTELDLRAKQHPVTHVALVATWDELVAAIRSGYPVPVCSGQGFSSTRDRQGFAAPRGSWAHCMCFIAVRFDREGALVLNSWGPSWISGPKWPDDMPEGAFWADRSVVERMLRGRDSFCVGEADGWKRRNLDHRGGWFSAPKPDDGASIVITASPAAALAATARPPWEPTPCGVAC